MLQIEKVKTSGNRRSDFAQPVSQAELLAALLCFIRRQYLIVVVVLFLAVGLGAIYLFITPPIYTARTAMFIDARRVNVLPQQSGLGDVVADAAMIESQVEIIKSANVALSVIKDMHLTEDPEFDGSSGGLMGALFGLITGPPVSKEPPSEFALTQNALALFQSRLNVRRLGLTYVLEITFQSRDPDRSAQIANGVADAYIRDQLDSKYETMRRAAAWLEDRLKELRTDASTADRAVVDFKSQNNIIDTGGRLINEQQLAELNSALVQARAQVAETKARLDRVTQVLQTGNQDPAATATGTVTDTLHNEVITRLRQTYLDYAAKVSDLSRRYGLDHLAVVNLSNQMREIRRNIIDELKRIAETYQSDFEIAKARELSIQNSLAKIIFESQTTNQAQIALRELESTSLTYRELYDNFLQRYMESIQQQSFPITEARIITQASPPLGKSSPKSLLVLAVTAFGGGILGVGLAILRDLSDNVFRTGNQVENYLQNDCIAIVPFIKSSDKEAPHADKSEVPPAGPQKIIRRDKRDKNVWWQVIDAPFSRFAESIRLIKLAADLTGVPKSIKVIGVTSSLPNEGKSTVAMALAELIATTGARVVLVDYDQRNASLSRKLAPGATVGIVDLFANMASFEQVLWRDTTTDLHFLPTAHQGCLPPASELLSFARTKAIFDQLREDFDYIVVDLLPLASPVDVRATTGLIDSYLFVIEWGRTKIDIVEYALQTARFVHDNLLGVVLNKADMTALKRYVRLR